MVSGKRFSVLATSIAVAASGLVLTAPAADASSIYRNCTALHTRWKHGVGRQYAHDHTSGVPVTNFTRSTYWYRVAMNHNAGLDRDRDGIACEAH